MNLFSSLTARFSRKSNSNSARRERGRKRRLLAESLEARQLMAGDFFHNHFNPEDVNDDGDITPGDALAIVNAINRSANTVDRSMFTDVNGDGQQTAVDAIRVINRLNRRNDTGLGDPGRPKPPSNDSLPNPVDQFSSIDGSGNNLANPDWGSAGIDLIRIGDADYSDSISTPAGEDRPSARSISNLIFETDVNGVKSERDLSAFIYVWGQFLDHDIDLSLTPNDPEAKESFGISVPTDDPLFNPSGSEGVEIPLTRSDFNSETGTSTENPRQQVNSITGFIDGSQIYGSSEETTNLLREFSGGRMRIGDDGLLPKDEDGRIQAGDIRAAENPSLTALHALFLREHNRIAEELATQNPDWSDEELFQQARAVVVAELQSITYNEFLPALLGPRGLTQYRGYDESVNPSIANEFSTAAYRFGHSTLNDDIGFFDNSGRPVADEVALSDAFFATNLLEEFGLEAVLKYDASSVSQEIDTLVVDGLRNFLFGPPGAGGLDLAALNIQRGRDHGLDDYNSTRQSYGLEAYDSFDDITSDVALQESLEELYGDINNIDLWVGLLAEDHVRGGSVGELTATIIADQFQRLRDGDRFYFENVYNRNDANLIQRTTLSDIIERNTDITGLQGNVFVFRAAVSGQVMQTNNLANGTNNRGPRGGGPVAVEGAVVELLNEAGEVVDSTTTDRRGNYRFDSFNETGDYSVRLAETGDTLEFLVSTGDVRLRGLNFAV